ncbi:MAG: PilZ domain-containing protein [Candidatus Omnitrophota bacterium]
MFASKQIFKESRNSLRVRENLKVRWRIKDSDLNGEGRVRNISTSGMLLEADSLLSPIDRCIFIIESIIEGKGSFLPPEGRLVWSKNAGIRNQSTLCGIEFIGPNPDILTSLRGRVQTGITKLASARRIKSIVGSVLVLVMFTMSVFVVYQHMQNYSNIQASHEVLSGAYEHQQILSQTYAGQVNSLRAELTEAQQFLADAKAANADLQAMVNDYQNQLIQNKAEFDRIIADLNDKNAQLNSELAVVRERLRIFEGDIRDLEEGRSTLSLYRSKWRLIKGKMGALKREAYLAKVTAQNERDRVEMLMGNNGYLVKDGKNYQPNQMDAQSPRNVEIDVQFYK